MAAEKGVDLLKQLGMRRDVHALTRMIDSSINQAGLVDISIVAPLSTLLDSSNSMDESDPPVYTALSRIKPVDLSLNAWAERAGLARNAFNYMRKHGNPKRATLVKLLAAIGWTLDQFETEAGLYPVQTEVRSAGPVGHDELAKMVFGDQPLAPLPLFGSAEGGIIDDNFQLTELHLTEVLDYLRRPASLADDKDSYALTIVGDSMSPRFKHNERVGVSPKAQIDIGDDVIVQLRDGDGEDDRVKRVLIKELHRRNATHIELKQHNPPKILRIERRQIVAMHKVKGHFL